MAVWQATVYPPDVLIEVPRTACRSLEFYRAAEVIDIGRELAAAVLDELDELEKPTPES
jgi:NTE family protein